MNALLEQFVGESREILEKASALLLEMEKGVDETTINDLFRAVHTLKGASGLFEVQPLTRVVHAAEDVLDRVRAGELELTPEIVDALLDGLDQVSAWIDDLEATEQLGEGAVQVGEEITARLRGMLGDGDGDTAGEAGSAGTAAAGPLVEGRPSWADELAPEVLDRFRELLEETDGPLTAVRYEPDPGCFYTGDDPLLTVREAGEVAWAEVTAREPWPGIDDFDPYECNLVFRVLYRAEPGTLLEAFQYVPDQVSVAALTPAWFDGSAPAEETSEDAAADAGPAPAADLPDDARELLETQRRILTLPCEDGAYEGRILSTARFAGNVLRACGLDEAAAGIDERAERCLADGKPDALTSYIAEILAGEATGASPAPEAATEEAAEPATTGESPAPTAEPEPAPAPPTEAAAPSRRPSAPPKRPAPESRQESAATSAAAEMQAAQQRQGASAKPLKVDPARIDALMDLVGELVVAKNGLPFLARRAEEEYGSRELAKEIKAQHAVINRIAEELQAAVMQVRMVPVSRAVQRLPRLVRDVARKLGKEVNLRIVGEDVEADKTVVEELGEPLIHLVRNSLDHGLESPEDREAAGKPREGTIEIVATQREDHVTLEIRDDGRGIDPEVIKRKAWQKGLIDEGQLESMSDHEALQLIFAPGFSTAEQVSDLSGRGVGMDVVRTMVKRCGGEVNVASERGRGTTITLKLPLSMAVSRVLTIEVGDNTFGVPLESIVETVRLPDDAIHRVKDRDVVNLRDRVIPVAWLHDLLGLERTEPEGEEAELPLLVVQVDGQEAGLVVDRFLEGIDIILKPLEGLMAAVRQYSGSALLGDGSVLLVLNLKELLARMG